MTIGVDLAGHFCIYLPHKQRNANVRGSIASMQPKLAFFVIILVTVVSSVISEITENSVTLMSTLTLTRIIQSRLSPLGRVRCIETHVRAHTHSKGTHYERAYNICEQYAHAWCVRDVNVW